MYGGIDAKGLDAAVAKLNLSMPAYKRISRVALRKEPFPKTSSGKIKLSNPDELQTR